MESPFAPPRNHSWQRVSPRLARMRRTVLVGAGVPFVVAVAAGCAVASATAGLAIAVAGLVLLVIAWISIGRNQRSWGYVERSDDLLVTHGALFKKLTVVPYGRMQLVDVEAGPIERSSVWSTSSCTPPPPPPMPRCAGSHRKPPPSSVTGSPSWARHMPAASEAPGAERPAIQRGEETYRLHPLTPVALGGRVLA